MASYKLPLKSLSIGVQEFNYHLNAAFFNDIEATDVREASVDVVVKVDRKDDSIYQLSFEFGGELTIHATAVSTICGTPLMRLTI